MADMTLQANIDAIVSIGAITNLAMKTFTGGAVTSDVARTRDPGAAFDRANGSPRSIGDVTVGVNYEESTHGPLLALLRSYVGNSNIPGTVGHIRRDGAGNRVGMTTYTGMLTSVTPPTGDTNGGNAKSTLELVFACSGVSG